MRLAVILLAALALGAPAAHAQEPLPTTYVRPAEGQTLTDEVEPFVIHTDPGRGAIIVEIATANMPGQDGTLADDYRVASIALFPRDSVPGHYEGELDTRRLGDGTYYWQASAGSYRTPVYTFNLSSPEPPPMLRAAELPSMIRTALRSETGRRPRDIRRDCDRRSRTAFRCKIDWIDSRYIYAGTLRIREESDRFTSRFRGARASKSCIRRSGVRRCARRHTWG